MNLDHPHVGNPQPACMCIDCREWRRVALGSSDACTDAGKFHIARFGMMRGKGFIVIDPALFSVDEFLTIEEAQDEATVVMGRNGRAIIYAPVAVVRPDVPTAVRVTSGNLLAQIGANVASIRDSLMLPPSASDRAQGRISGGSDAET